MRLLLCSLFFVLILCVFGTDKSCPKPSAAVLGTTNKGAKKPKSVPACNPNNVCSFSCGKYSKNKCQGTSNHLITDTVEYKKVCPFEGARLRVAQSYINKFLQSVPAKGDLIATEILAQGDFWKRMIEYLSTFKNLKTPEERIKAQKNTISGYIQKQFNTYFNARVQDKKQGSNLVSISKNQKLYATFQQVVKRLSNAISIVGLSRKCRCVSFIQKRYDLNAPQTEKDKQWNFASLVLQQWVDGCKVLPEATSLCKTAKVTTKDVSCAALPDEKGCLPAFSKIYQETISPLKNKLASGDFQAVKQRDLTPKVPKWFKDAQKEKNKAKGKKKPTKKQQAKPTTSTTPAKKPTTVEVKPTTPAKKPTTTVEPKPTTPATKPAETPKSTPTTPTSAPKPVEAPKTAPITTTTPAPTKQSTPAPTAPTKSAPTKVGQKAELAPLKVPKIPKKETPKVVVPSTNDSKSTTVVTPKPTAPVVKPKKLPKGPAVYQGKKKKITIANQK